MANDIPSALGAILASTSSDATVLARAANAALGHDMTQAEADAINGQLEALAKAKDPKIEDLMKRLHPLRVYPVH